MKIETTINDDIVLLDTEDVWLEVFAEWDAKVQTKTAEKIATATVAIIESDYARPTRTAMTPDEQHRMLASWGVHNPKSSNR